LKVWMGCRDDLRGVGWINYYFWG